MDSISAFPSRQINSSEQSGPTGDDGRPFHLAAFATDHGEVIAILPCVDPRLISVKTLTDPEIGRVVIPVADVPALIAALERVRLLLEPGA